MCLPLMPMERSSHRMSRRRRRICTVASNWIPTWDFTTTGLVTLRLTSDRFWTRDNVDGDHEDPLSLHKYLYGGDDPVNRIDPSGHDEEVEQLVTTGIMGMMQRYTFTVVARTLTFVERNPGLFRAFLIAQAFVTIQAVHEDPSQCSLSFESGGFAADAEMLQNLVGDVKGAMVLYRQTDSLGRSCGISQG